MKDEIKEILDLLAFLEDIKTQKKVKQVKDYITNLQEENRKLKELKYKFFYCSDDEESFTLEDYLELGNELYDLQEENKQLLKKSYSDDIRITKAINYIEQCSWSNGIDEEIQYSLHVPTLINILKGEGR